MCVNFPHDFSINKMYSVVMPVVPNKVASGVTRGKPTFQRLLV